MQSELQMIQMVALGLMFLEVIQAKGSEQQAEVITTPLF